MCRIAVNESNKGIPWGNRNEERENEDGKHASYGGRSEKEEEIGGMGETKT